jgi:alpha-galactosidase
LNRAGRVALGDATEYRANVIRILLPAISLLAAAALAAADPAPLTPKPGPAPRINGPRLYGARPGRPFLYRIPCSGTRPIDFTAKGLPAGLSLDRQTGIITGKTPARPGNYSVTITAKNKSGAARRVFTIVAGDRLALTPPMGWNHWYTHYDHITDALMREAADVMISSGMADAGYEFVSIDDCWMAKPGSTDPELAVTPRDPSGAILANRRFPDMKGLTAYIHGKGLKAGIYTSPGPLTCARFEASYQHEDVDAKRFAEWGFDLLKYDWCSYRTISKGTTDADRQKPYEQMGAILKSLDRDVQFNLCQYGMNDVWKWGAKVGGHSWRTTGDLGVEKDTRLPGFYTIAFKNMQHAQYAGPGGWNDPDYILIGYIGNARKQQEPQRRANLTADEQYSYMSMWSLMASPLFYSGLMGKLDEFTLNVLCNPEVIDVNQDALGKQARVVRKTEDELVLAKPLEDGSLAVGLFNLSEQDRKVSASWKDLGLTGKKAVRDVWRHKNIGQSQGSYEATVPRHGVMMVRLGGKAAR